MPDPDAYQAEDDVGELTAWCDRCAEQRVFVKGYANYADLEAGLVGPSVQRAIVGEPGWLCEHCDNFLRDPVAAADYPLAFENVNAIRDEEAELTHHGEGISEDLGLRAEAVAGTGMLHEPATEEGALHEAGDATLEEPIVEDEQLEREILEAVGRQERGEEDLSLPHGPRREMPPPERLPPRDPDVDD